MPQKTSMILVLGLVAGAALTPSHARAPQPEFAPAEIAIPAPTPLSVKQLPLSMQEKLASGFQHAYGLAEPPDLDSLSQIQIQEARVGESAKGVVVLEKSGQLYLDSTPCESSLDRKQVFPFIKPYDSEEADDKLCTDPARTYKMKKVTQR